MDTPSYHGRHTRQKNRCSNVQMASGVQIYIKQRSVRVRPLNHYEDFIFINSSCFLPQSSRASHSALRHGLLLPSLLPNFCPDVAKPCNAPRTKSLLPSKRMRLTWKFL